MIMGESNKRSVKFQYFGGIQKKKKKKKQKKPEKTKKQIPQQRKTTKQNNLNISRTKLYFQSIDTTINFINNSSQQSILLINNLKINSNQVRKYIQLALQSTNPTIVCLLQPTCSGSKRTCSLELSSITKNQ
eukprot:TRINITY_DN10716_c0_g1_i2.p1 TRINITY_DN10716_c0_g1~~TRINITY_DN10716_c0_g1_i2.p1  ORF type:complete len:132 (+),score=8.39 TRINITY_DN10716_c0_g1_i2:148-543(+)